MKTFAKRVLGALALLLASINNSFAVFDQALQVQGTNLVLSWPSTGKEIYLIQYRPTLDPGTPWQTLTNDYPANSTNRTTYVIPCCALVGLAGGSGMMSFSSNASGGSSLMMDSIGQFKAAGPKLWAMSADGTGAAVPLALYPPGTNTKNLIIFEAPELETRSKSAFQMESFDESQNSPLGISNGGCDCPDMGFFRVFHIPDFPASITNSVFAGPIFLPVNFADYRERVENIGMLIDGELTPHADYISLFYNNQTNWGMGIYFDRFTNGTHQIRLISTLHINDDVNNDAIYLELTNLARTITVSNQVAFPDWNDVIQGDTYTFNAQIANPNTDWQIDIYDVGNNYVNSGSRHTTNGQVSWTWDLTDYLSNSRDNFDSDPFFYSYITFNAGTSQSQTTQPTPIPVKGYPNRGEWVIAFQDRQFSDAPGYPSDLQGLFMNAMQEIWGGPNLVGDTAQWYPIRFGTNAYTQAERDYSMTNLLSWIGDLYSRNFYYHGHGGATAIGADRHTLDTNGLIVGSALESRSKSQIFSWQVAQKTRYNRYRFVFLDGCSTAAGNWPNAFNISKTNHDISFYENHPKHPRPSVFVGWIKDIGGKDYGNAYDSLNFESNWMGIWANGSGFPSIKLSLEDANSLFHWLTIQKFNEDIRIYGYQDMTIRDYNRKGDWRWP